MNSQNLIESFLDIDNEIENKFFKKTAFKDENLEKKFQNESIVDQNMVNSVSNLIVILGYLATFLYICFAFFRSIFIITCFSCFILTILSIFVSSKTDKIEYKLLNDHIQIFLSSFNLSIKAIIICVYYNTTENDNTEELLRIIIYDFVSTNIFIIVKMEADYRTNLFYFFQSLTIICICHIFSNKNHYFFLEMITSFFVYFIFFCLRKEWDYKLRNVFSQKYKFERTYKYIDDYLIGLNGYNFNIKNSNNFYINKKLNKLIHKTNLKTDINDDLTNKIKNKFTDLLKIDTEENDKENMVFNILRQSSEENHNEKDNKFFEFLDKLVLFENNYLFKAESNVNNPSRNTTNSDKSLTLLDLIIKGYNNNNKSIKKSKFETNKSSFFQQILLKIIRLFSKNSQNSKKILTNFKSEKVMESKIEIKFDEFCSVMNPSKLNLKNGTLNYCENLNSYGNLKKENTKENMLTSKCNMVNLETNEFEKKISFKNSNIFKKKSHQENNSYGNFVNVGKFYYENKENLERYYFDILHRVVKMGYENLLEDYFIYDITELINDKRIIEDNIKKQKIFAKISHEFKTPLNSIISLIESIDFYENSQSELVKN